ncbi:hypothetical protein D3C80_1969330 [compost metagenome]
MLAQLGDHGLAQRLQVDVGIAQLFAQCGSGIVRQVRVVEDVVAQLFQGEYQGA